MGAYNAGKVTLGLPPKLTATRLFLRRMHAKRVADNVRTQKTLWLSQLRGSSTSSTKSLNSKRMSRLSESVEDLDDLMSELDEFKSELLRLSHEIRGKESSDEKK